MGQCATCHAGCCRSFAVPVTGADILRIMSQRKLAFWDFVCRWADPEGKIALKYAPHFHFRDHPDTPFVISLIQDESRVFPGTTRCTFLAEGPQSREHPLGISACGIYGERPSACRVFPTRFDHSGELAVIYDVPPTGRAGGHPAYQLCPRAWTPEDLDPLQQVQDLAIAKFEMNFFFKLAAAWNAGPGEWRLFPDFLQSVYARRVIADEDDREIDPVPQPTDVIRYPRLAA